MNNLTTSYYDLGRRQEAIELRGKVLEAYQKTLGNDHPKTIEAMQGLADWYNE
jgi:hypothetical protein